jgi:SagB-type dehydrogenase family enzyme
VSGNRHSEAARRYHDATMHSAQSVRTGGHGLDWATKPEPFKIYPGLPVVALPRDFSVPDRDALAAISGGPSATARLDLERLAALLFFSAGVTKRQVYPGGGTMYFRAAPSTGALYQTEVYVVAAEVEGLDTGVYHFSPGDFSLRRLREGDFRGVLAIAAADEDLASRPATLVLSAIYWRNTWKYQARGYRHLFWDSGSMLSNLLAAANALDLPARVVTGFVDLEVNGLLALDGEKEGALVLTPVGGQGTAAPAAPVIGTIEPEVIPLSSSEVDYPLLRDAYANSALDSESEVLAWREAAHEPSRPPPAGALVALPAPRPSAGRTLAETIMARGSTREFSGAAIGADLLSTALWHATRSWPADVASGLVDVYLTVHAVEGLEPGSYVYHPESHALELIRRGDFRRQSAYLCLEQSLGGMSSATVFFLADLAALLEAYGNRGYRLANLEAGLYGGRLYLCAYAQRFGATGLTFYDQDVVDFFSPHARGKDAIFVTALGRSVKGPVHSPAPLQIGRPPSSQPSP